MPHVFVETNWVVDCTAPAHNKVPAALDLLRRARDGEIQLHLPAICLAEARHPLFTKFQTRQSADRVRQFVTWAVSANRLTPDQGNTVRTSVDLMENVVKADLQNMGTTLRELAGSPGLEVFPTTPAMLTRSTELCFELPELKSSGTKLFWQLYLSELMNFIKLANENSAFCQLDSDLQPWDKNGDAKPKLTDLYDRANVWVYGDFLMHGPEMPPNWYERR